MPDTMGVPLMVIVLFSHIVFKPDGRPVTVPMSVAPVVL